MRKLACLSLLVALFACGGADPHLGLPTAAPAAAGDPTAAATGTSPVAAPSATVSAAPSASAVAGEEPPRPAEPLPRGMTVLVVGDSFAQALGVGLKSKEEETGIKFVLRGEQATFIPEWAGPNRGLAALVKQSQPDLVVISLGGNELAMTTPEIRAPKVRALVALLDGTPCVWVAPPLWGNKDNGLLSVIRDNSSPCRHFDSNKLTPNLPRGGDKIHPTAEGQKLWARDLLAWLGAERDPSSAPRFGLRPRPAGE